MATKTLEQTKLKAVFDFFHQFSKWISPSPATPTVNELEKYLAKDFQMFNNGKAVVKGSSHYLERLKNFQKKYSKFQISEPLEEPILSEKHAALYYKLDLTTHQGQHKQIFIAALFELENDKIKRWVEVTSEKEPSSTPWDA